MPTADEPLLVSGFATFASFLLVIQGLVEAARGTLHVFNAPLAIEMFTSAPGAAESTSCTKRDLRLAAIPAMKALSVDSLRCGALFAMLGTALAFAYRRRVDIELRDSVATFLLCLCSVAQPVITLSAFMHHVRRMQQHRGVQCIFGGECLNVLQLVYASAQLLILLFATVAVTCGGRCGCWYGKNRRTSDSYGKQQQCPRRPMAPVSTHRSHGSSLDMRMGYDEGAADCNAVAPQMAFAAPVRNPLHPYAPSYAGTPRRFQLNLFGAHVRQ